MKRKIELNIETFSVNDMSYRDKRYKTPQAHDWSHRVLHQLNKKKNKQALKDLREVFNPSKHAYAISITSYFPEKKYFTSTKRMSSRTHDISNIEKPLIDLIFLPKYYGTNSPYEAENLNIDDRYLQRMFSQKLPSDQFKIIANISILKLSLIERLKILFKSPNP